MKTIERFIKYISVPTPSNASSKSCPSTASQFELANLLVEELKELNIINVKITEHCFVYGSLPASNGYENVPKLGFIAHLDTVSDYCDHPVIPIIHSDYDGRDLPLGNSGRILDTASFPHLKNLTGQTLITSDGTTILGADNKAGIVEIVSMLEYILTYNIPHGTICFAFIPDEEMYNEVFYFDTNEFGADYAFTLDGETEGEIQYETFNTCQATFNISIPPENRNAKKNNACLIAATINGMLPHKEIPRHTEMYEGYYHLRILSGNTQNAYLCYSIHEHDNALFTKRKETLQNIEERINQTYGKDTVSLHITDYLRNMAETVIPHIHLIENAVLACEKTSITPKIIPMRGATAGVRISFLGLPCPNLGTGGHAYHSPYEHITVESMDKVVQMLIELVRLYADTLP